MIAALFYALLIVAVLAVCFVINPLTVPVALVIGWAIWRTEDEIDELD